MHNTSGTMSTRLFLVAILSACVAPAIGLADGPTGEAPFVRSWLLLGPIDCPTDQGVDIVRAGHEADLIGGESGIAPKAGDQTAAKEWTAYESPTDTLDFLRAFDAGKARNNAAAYAVATIESADGGPAWLAMGSDDTLKVWLNGKLVHDKVAQRGVKADEDLVQVTLKPGANRLLLKVVNGSGRWGLACRVLDREQMVASISKRLVNADLSCQAVFSGTALPEIALDIPVVVGTLVDIPTIETTYYDAEFKEVTTAETPGRYGAIVKITAAGADKPARTEKLTLFRTAGRLGWRPMGGSKETSRLPKELGIAPAVAEANAAQLDQFLVQALTGRTRGSIQAAVLLAALSEFDAEASEAVNASTRDDAWWYALAKSQGKAGYEHFLILPEGYEASGEKTWPLVLFLHGAGERGEDLERVAVHGPVKRIRQGKTFPFILVAPQCPSRQRWNPVILADLLDIVQKDCRVDPDRVYVTGLSMGGYGTWTLAMTYPERFAAIAPICGYGDPSKADRLKDLPTWVFHGGKDTTVPLDRSQGIVDAMRQVGAKPVLTIYPNAGHDSWTATYNTDTVYEWLLSNKRGQPNIWPDPKYADPEVYLKSGKEKK